MDKFNAMQMFVRAIEKGASRLSQRNLESVNLLSANRSPPLKMKSAPT
jgi:hypothetical protein